MHKGEYDGVHNGDSVHAQRKDFSDRPLDGLPLSDPERPDKATTAARAYVVIIS